MAMGARPTEQDEQLKSFERFISDSKIRLVCDTNVYLNAREAIGVESDGRLRFVFEPAAKSPDVAILRAPQIAGFESHFVVALAVRNELFYMIRGGYAERPEGLHDARLAATALKSLMDLHPHGQMSMGESTTGEHLPNPPLSDAEKNDRQIWGQAKASNAILVTSDGPLIQAVRQTTGESCAALRPIELRDVAKLYADC